MDAVVLFINPAAPSVKQRLSAFNVSVSRFYDWGFLPFVLRSIEKNVPFVENVYLCVGSADEVPNYINTSSVRVKTNADYIPPSYNIVCNSNSVELNLFRIPELSEEFMVINDDMFMASKVLYSDLFENGLPKTNLMYRILQPNSYRMTLKNSENWAMEMAGVSPRGKVLNRFLKSDHAPHCVTKKLLQMVWDHNYCKLDKLITPTRSPSNITIDTVSFYLYHKGLLKPRGVRTTLLNVNTSLETIRSRFDGSYGTVVINDEGCDNRSARKEELLQLLESIFPDKSKYEL